MDGHVLQQVQLQGRDPFKGVRGQVLARIWQKLGGLQELTVGLFF